MEKRPGEYSSGELINRTPKLKARRDELASWPSLIDADRGDVRELINLAAICLGLWEVRGCKEDDLIVDLAERFLHAGGLFGLEEQLRLGGSGTIGEGVLEYEHETILCSRSALAALENHQRALEYVSREYFGRPAEEWVAVATALVVDGLSGIKDWRNREVVSPVGLVRKRSGFIAKEQRAGGRTRPTDALSREQDREVLSLDAPEASTDPKRHPAKRGREDSLAALIPDTTNSRWDADVCTQADLESVCKKAELPKEAQLLALAKYFGLPRDCAAEFMLFDPKRVEAARKRLDRAWPEVQAGLEDYRKPTGGHSTPHGRRPKVRCKK